MKTRDELVKELQVLNFSKMEALVYVTLVKHSKLNGSQIAKTLNMSRSSVYSALNNLYHRGVVSLLPGESNLYKAEDPEMLIEKMKQHYVESADLLKRELSTFRIPDSGQEYYNIKGYQNFVVKTRELLSQARQEVYMNTCFDLRIFAGEFEELKQRKVRVIVFSFENVHAEEVPVEFYRKHIPGDGGEHLRMMLVVDLKKALIAGSYQGGEVIGTFTENPLLVAIVSEHIHLDIYLLKLQQKEKSRGLLDSLSLHTLLEQDF